MIKVTNTILPQARLPFVIIKGNCKIRQSKASEKCEQLYKILNTKTGGMFCTINDFKQALDSVLMPYKINYQIKEMTDKKLNGGLQNEIKPEIIDNNSISVKHVGYIFNFKNPEENKNLVDKYVALHEARHFFDKIYNPKYALMLCKNSINHPDKEETRNTIYQKFFNMEEKSINITRFKKEITQLTNSLPKEMNIELLQKIRYSLQSEINAYSQEIKFRIKDAKTILDIMIIANLIKQLVKNFKFHSKLEFANSTLKNILKKN